MRHFPTIVTSIILASIYCVKTLADVSYADLFLSGRGYKPVEDVWPVKSLMTYPSTGNATPDNQLYRKWCINTFNNGEQIYQAYKEIAFDIDYRAEPPKTDYWQTPVETQQMKQGDCEDSVFLFFSLLSELDIDGDIIWGWIIGKDNSIAFAHVWYQLFDKRGRPYVVEGFSKEWNGIIPVEMTTEGEERIPTFMVRHNQVNHVVNGMIPKYDHDREFSESFENAQFHWNIFGNNTNTIREIFQKLQDMFCKYREQLH